MKSDMQERYGAFTGCTEDMYRFLWEIAFQNNEEFYQANKDRFRQSVKEPLLRLAEALSPVIGEIDPGLNTRPSSVVSRIRRDTRFSKNKAPFRDYMWLGFKPQDLRNSESFMLYVDFERTSFGYGMGMYMPDAEMMGRFRARIMAEPQRFTELICDPAFTETFTFDGAAYQRKKYHHEDPLIEEWLNKRSVSFHHADPDLEKTLHPDVLEDIKKGLLTAAPLYRFFMGTDL